jgi:hypothetical protein
VFRVTWDESVTREQEPIPLRTCVEEARAGQECELDLNVVGGGREGKMIEDVRTIEDVMGAVGCVSKCPCPVPLGPPINDEEASATRTLS